MVVKMQKGRTANIPANNIFLTSVQCLRRWSNIVQLLYKCLVFTGIAIEILMPHVMSLSVS